MISYAGRHNAPAMTAKKSGTLAKRRKQAEALKRDRKIYRFLRLKAAEAAQRQKMVGYPVTALSVYIGDPSQPNRRFLSQFPFTEFQGRPMPKWVQLTDWMKTQVLVTALNEWELLTFTVHVHPDLEHQWITGEKDPVKMVRDRVRKEVSKVLGPRNEYFFVMEGWSKLAKAQTFLHIHGGFFLREPGTQATAMKAIARACGHGIKGYRKKPKAVHNKIYWGGGARYVNYIFKSVRRPDQRLAGRKLVFSREATGAARAMWGLMTDPRKLCAGSSERLAPSACCKA